MTDFTVLGIHLVDLKVALSDIVLSLAFLWCWRSLRANTAGLDESGFIKSWRRFFLMLCVSFFLGAFAHALVLYTGEILHLLAWYFAVFGLFYFQRGMVQATFGNIETRTAVFLIILLAAGTIAATIFISFYVILIYAFFSFFYVLRINMIKKIFSFKQPCSKQIVYGTGMFLLAGIGFVLKMRLFFLDAGTLSHILITIGIFFFGKGCLSTINELTSARTD